MTAEVGEVPVPKVPVHVNIQPDQELVAIRVGHPDGGPDTTVEISFGDWLEVTAGVLQVTVARAREAAAKRAAADGHVIEMPRRSLVLPNGQLHTL